MKRFRRRVSIDCTGFENSGTNASRERRHERSRRNERSRRTSTTPRRLRLPHPRPRPSACSLRLPRLPPRGFPRLASPSRATPPSAPRRRPERSGSRARRSRRRAAVHPRDPLFPDPANPPPRPEPPRRFASRASRARAPGIRIRVRVRGRIERRRRRRVRAPGGRRSSKFGRSRVRRRTRPPVTFVSPPWGFEPARTPSRRWRLRSPPSSAASARRVQGPAAFIRAAYSAA